MTFGEKLSKLRRANNYTQEQLADVLEVSRQSVSKWESDIAYPETDKLVKIGKLFNCSLDYLLKENCEELEPLQRGNQKARKTFGDSFKDFFKERKSSKKIWGMPLFHIGKNARGFFAIGLKAQGIFSIGLLSMGIFSIGLLSLGLLSVGILAVGLASIGNFAFGVFALGTIAFGLLAVGPIAVGVVSFGALSVGCFSSGALAIGKYVAVGDHAYALIAIGESRAVGNIYSHVGTPDTADMLWITQWLDFNVPNWLWCAKELFGLYLI